MGEGQKQDADRGSNQDFSVSAPAISLPKGGGAIRGIGEKFAANPVTGTGTITVPIYCSPGRAGFGPKLALSYDSGAGNGPFGFGWNLSVPAITRKTDKGLPRYRDAGESDVFVLAGAEDLVPELGIDGKLVETTRDGYQVRRYYPRIEGSFARIERWTGPDGTHWRSISRDNVTTIYGRTLDSRIVDPADQARVFSWLVSESYDDKGNAIVYSYAAEDFEGVDRFRPHERNRQGSRSAGLYLKRVRYGNRTPRRTPADVLQTAWMFEIVFDYGEGHWETIAARPDDVRASATPEGIWPARPDAFSSYRAGFEVRSYRRCHRILMFHRFDELGTDPYLVRSTELDYGDLDYTTDPGIETELAHPGSTRFASFLRRVTQRGHVQDSTVPPVVRGLARYLTYLTRSLPPIELDYSRAKIHDEVREVDRESLENLPVGLDGAQYQWVDLDGEGLSGVLTEQAGAWFYKRNLAVLGAAGATPRFGPLEQLRTMPAPANLAGGQQLLDLSGNGRLDVVQFGGALPGYFERTPDAGWESFTPFASVPNVAFADPNLRFVDLTGDGHADLLLTDDGVFTWYPSLAEQGFGAAERVHQERDEERGPHLVFADGTQSIYLADMSGDGLSDLVRIRNGEVCYWPSLGYGRFGAKVTIDHSPWFDAPDRFDQRRIRLADIDGSGTTDILYLEPDGVSLHFNRSGNSFGAPRKLAPFPHIDNLSSVSVVDLLGNGTACLVWSSPLACDGARPMRYIDLMGGGKPHLLGGGKPHLLVSVRNNLGAETRIEYAPSTKFYLADKLAGTPWITRLPFPVHCVEHVTVTDDWRKTSFSTTYSYHHGYFDGVEREFRGFGRVDQVDVQSFGEFAAGNSASPYITPDKTLYQPPVKTVTWYHTGASLEEVSQVSGPAPTSFAAEVSSDHPIAFYRMNESAGATSALDASGNANHGSLSSTGITMGVPGLGAGDTAARFDGLDSGRIIVPDKEILNPKNITMEALVTWSGPNGYQQRVLEKSFGTSRATQPDYGLGILDSGVVRAELTTATHPARFVDSMSRMEPDQPTHLAATYDGINIAIYINGILDTSGPAGGDISSTFQVSDLGIGNQVERVRPFHGVIDEVVLYDKALSAERIRVHAAAAGVSPSTSTPRERVLSHHEDEYFRPEVPNGFREHVLPEPVLAETLTADERREALRACKGSVLRQEVYELDVDALDARGEHRPVRLFTTAFHNCHIQCLQPRGTNLHAVFLVTESEAITYHYDLDLRAEAADPDPRVAHTMNLAIDKFGNVLQSVAVVYPRHGQHVDTGLPPGAEAMIAGVQRDNPHLAYTENRFTTDAIDDDQDYRLPAPCEVMTYELTGVAPKSAYFDIAELRKLVLSDKYPAHAIPPGATEPVGDLAYHQLPTSGTIEKRLVEHVRILYFDAGLTGPRPLGELGARGLPFETYKLALTEDLLAAVFDAKLTTTLRAELAEPTRSGYLSGELLESRFGAASAGQYWIRSGVAVLDAARFYLPMAYVDAFDNRTELTYLHDLLVASRTDAMLNTVSVEAFDLRVLAPARMKDINDNVSKVVFDALGMPTAMALMAGGDDVTGLEVPPSLQRVTDFFTEAYAENEAALLLGNATARHLYYFGERREADGSLSWGHHPASAATILRERHVADLPAGGRLQAAFEYSDGAGAVLVKKTKAEPAPNTTTVRWIAGGKTVLNNKGKPVKQYEPYFSSNEHRFEELVEVGVTPVLYYDAVGRLIRTESPDGSYSRVELSPWHVASYDANDTVGEAGNAWYARHSAATATAEMQRAASLVQVHAGTPAVTFLDSFGRDVIAVQHERFQYPGDPAPSAGTKHVTFTKLDAEGKPLWIRDVRGNLVMQYIRPPMADSARVDAVGGFAPCYDIAGNLLFQHSMDSGERWILNDAAGKPMFAWDANQRAGQLESRFAETRYDALHRPTELWLQTNTGAAELVERFEYGEDVAGDRARNLRGQVRAHHDPSGLSTVVEYDFTGKPREVTRQLAEQYDAPRIDWQTATLELETFTQITKYDALGRIQLLYSWHRANDRVAVYKPSYNDRGLLESEVLVVRATKRPDGYDEGPDSKRTSVIEAITYDAKGQREAIRYGNKTQTRFTYDPQTFRLVQLRTTRPGYDPTFPSAVAQFKNANVVQNLYYTYDPVGNITEIYDDAFRPAFFANQVIEPQARYTYDALYRLIAATGREHAESTAPGQDESPALTTSFPVPQTVPADPADQRNYTQRYRYDAVGNILQMEHTATSGWTRNYKYADYSNQLARTWFGDDTLDATIYEHDSHGNMLNFANVAPADHLQWDHRDMLQVLERGGGGRVYYQYDAGKQRTRKVSVTQNGAKAWERIYLGGMEIYRRYSAGDVVEETESHHVFEGEHRVLLVEDVIETNRPGATRGALYRYQYSNHLGSSCLELDVQAGVITYEEYHPYGTSAYRTARSQTEAPKRYRFTGMERDDESGLSYHGARYYAPWLARWVSCDPGGVEASMCLYLYCRCSPVTLVDVEGRQDERAVQSSLDELKSRKQALQRMGAATTGGNSSGSTITLPPDIQPSKSPEQDIEEDIASLEAYAEELRQSRSSSDPGLMAKGAWNWLVNNTLGLALIVMQPQLLGSEEGLKKYQSILANVKTDDFATRHDRERAEAVGYMLDVALLLMSFGLAGAKGLAGALPTAAESQALRAIPLLTDTQLTARAEALYVAIVTVHLESKGVKVTQQAIDAMRGRMTVAVLQGMREGKVVTYAAINTEYYSDAFRAVASSGEIVVEPIEFYRISATTGLPWAKPFSLHAEPALYSGTEALGLKGARVASSNPGCWNCVIEGHRFDVFHVNPVPFE